ncbi:hypothetical protein MASR2M8_01960 [Opitutaceae bacterium]
MKFPFATLALLLLVPLASRAADVAELWRERVKSVVAVEFFIETELDRRLSFAFATVIDDQGTIILSGVAISGRATPSQLKDFRIYRPGEPALNYSAGEYLGQDVYTGWHFIRIEEKGRAGLVPVTAFAGPVAAEPAVAGEVFGLGLRKKDEDFAPYFLTGRVSIIQTLPQRTAVATTEVASPGLPVFTKEGVFVGLGAPGFGQSYLMFAERTRGGQGVVLVNSDECAAFLLADEVLPNLGRIPKNVFGRPAPWLGANGLEPLDPEVAKFLKLEAQAGLVVSEVLEGSPAEKAGMKERDILLEVDGKPLPRLKPDGAVVGHVEREIDRRATGDVMKLTVLRGSERVELTATLEESPPSPREAERRYFEQLGLTIRAFTYADGVNRRVKVADHAGVVAHFVKPSTALTTAGLRVDDWIKEIDGQEIKTFADAVEKLEAIEKDTTRTEYVLLASRGGETAVLRVKLK